MTALIEKLLLQHFVFIMSVMIGFTALVIGLLIKLFHELRTEPEVTKRALKQEGRFVRGVIGIFRPSVLPKPGEPDPFAETQVPFKAVSRESIEKEQEL